MLNSTAATDTVKQHQQSLVSFIKPNSEYSSSSDQKDISNALLHFTIDQRYQKSSRKHMSTVLLSNESTITQNNV